MYCNIDTTIPYMIHLTYERLRQNRDMKCQHHVPLYLESHAVIEGNPLSSMISLLDAVNEHILLRNNSMSLQQITRPGQPKRPGKCILPWLSLVLISTLYFFQVVHRFHSQLRIQVTNCTDCKNQTYSHKKPTLNHYSFLRYTLLPNHQQTFLMKSHSCIIY